MSDISSEEEEETQLIKEDDVRVNNVLDHFLG